MDPIDSELEVKYDTSLGGTDSDDKSYLGGVVPEDKSKPTTLADVVPKDKSKSSSSTTGPTGKDVLDLIGKKLDPKEYAKKQFKKHFDPLFKSIVKDSSVKKADRLRSVEPAPVTKKAVGMLKKLTNASGKAPGSADSFVERSATKVISHLEKSSSSTAKLLESGGDMARAVVGGTKNSKNLRLAGAATLFAAAGYGIGKVKEHGKDIRKTEQRVDPDKEQQLRQSLLNDG